MGEVARVRTPVTARSLVAALVSAFRAEFGRAPTLMELEGMAALKWFETDGGRADNWNAGNLHASASYRASGRPWFRPVWWPTPTAATPERIRFLHAEMLANRAPEAFRSYGSLAEGLGDFMRVLRRDFPNLLAAMGTGDVVAMGRVAHEKYTPDASAETLARAYDFRRGQLRTARAFEGAMVSSGGPAAGAAAVAVVGVVALVVLIAASRGNRRKRAA